MQLHTVCTTSTCLYICWPVDTYDAINSISNFEQCAEQIQFTDLAQFVSNCSGSVKAQVAAAGAWPV